MEQHVWRTADLEACSAENCLNQVTLHPLVLSCYASGYTHNMLKLYYKIKWTDIF